MTLYRVASFLFTAALAVGCASSVCGEVENNDGGYSETSEDDANVVAAADFAAAEIAEVSDPLYDIVCAQIQVVAGTNYRLGLDIDDVTWRAVVFEDSDGALELTSADEVE